MSIVHLRAPDLEDVYRLSSFIHNAEGHREVVVTE